MKKAMIHESAFVAEGAVVIGDVELAEDVTIWFHAVIRADREKIKIGRGSNVQDCSVVHVDAGFPVKVGENVVIGHGAVVHGCEIGDNTLIGMGAIILNGAKIGRNCIIGAGTLVTQNTIIPDNSLAMGNPSKIKRQVTEEEMKAHEVNAAEYVEQGRKYKQEQKREA